MSEALGLYVHVPFCEAKCTYCHFAIDPRRPGEDRQERYLRALLAEVEAAPPGRAADTLYLGGGTPTLLALDRLERLFAALRRRFRLGPAPEVTVEANPRDLDRSGYRHLAGLGVNRLSLGVQSFDDGVLRDMGRLHDARAAVRAVEDARAAGFASLSVDLILGWPGETAARWRRNLQGIAALSPDHVSLYVLEVEGKTLLSHRASRGRLELPDDDLVAALYDETVAFLAGRGIVRYEISNFGRPGCESRHNGKYWDDAPFLGFGMAAHSYEGGRRWWNHEAFGMYCREVEERGGRAAVAGERVLGGRERAGEALFTGLRRTQGVPLGAFRERHGLDPLVAYGDPLRDAFAAGLLEVADDRLRLTPRGMLLSNEVFRAFV
jgi:oxygen-independent coproporphyrinogen III oxidase